MYYDLYQGDKPGPYERQLTPSLTLPILPPGGEARIRYSDQAARIRVEAAALNGRPVFFQIGGPWQQPDTRCPMRRSSDAKSSPPISHVVEATDSKVAGARLPRHERVTCVIEERVP
jgi:hypothetical protein